MYYKNAKHKQAFTEGLKRTDKKDKETLAILYLLSADPCLWQRAKKARVYGKIYLNNICLTNISEEGYVLLGAAKDITAGTKYLSLADLSDKSLISGKTYETIMQAIRIRRCGTTAMQEEKTQ